MDVARQDILEIDSKGGSFHTGKVYIAERLTGGKGRFQRSWHAPEGGVWLVLALVNTMLAKYTNLLPLAAGISCCETVRHYGVPARLKWVNDVHVAGKKLAGILLESMTAPTSGEEYVLIGIGINVNNTVFPEELAASAAGMRNYLPENLELSQVAAVLIAKLAWNIGLLCYQEEAELAEAPGGAPASRPPVMQAWRSLSDSIGRRVSYGFNVVSKPQYTAEVVGVKDTGELVMKLPDGREIVEAGGEIVYLD
jgi:BirA family biotin operon repressor/biotin-[acetyl-CoA-carboxylase] ligase